MAVREQGRVAEALVGVMQPSWLAANKATAHSCGRLFLSDFIELQAGHTHVQIINPKAVIGIFC
jgi:hypothetical protein